MIKEAIRIAKPFFFNGLMWQKLNREGQKVLDGFVVDLTGKDALFGYMFNMNYPKLRENPFFKRMISFNEERDRNAYLDAIFPDETHNFAIKNYLSLLGAKPLSGSLQEQE